MVEGFLRRQGITVNEAIELDEISGLIQLAANGVGVALVPLVEAHLPLPDSIRAVPLGEQTFYREIGLLQRRTRTSSPIVAQFSRCLAEASEAPVGNADARRGASRKDRRRPRA